MEPVTHALTSLVLSRAGLNRASRLATPMLLVAGLAPDVDWLSRLGGTRAFLAGYRTVTHSLLGLTVITAVVAGAFWWMGRKHAPRPVRFWPALVVCAAGAGAHLLLDVTNSYGVKLLWPFHGGWTAWDLCAPLDPWILALLLMGLLVPGLFRLVTEEIGARPRKSSGQRGAVIALFLLALYCTARWGLHDRALQMLSSRVYRSAVPMEVAAFPHAASPLDWSGIVETDNTLAQVDVPLGPGSRFDPEAARITYKPEPSPVLDAARNSDAARTFLEFARFPHARVDRTSDGYHVELTDIRFSARQAGVPAIAAGIDLNDQAQVVRERLYFPSRNER